MGKKRKHKNTYETREKGKESNRQEMNERKEIKHGEKEKA
jgi:hypothetical protein